MKTKTEINLDAFCASEPMPFDLLAPFMFEGNTYATDGVILIRLFGNPCGLPESEPNRKLPNPLKPYERNSGRELRFVACPKVSKPRGVDLFWRKDVEKDCKACNGIGACTCPCGEVGHGCVECGGIGREWKFSVVEAAYKHVDFEGCNFARRYIWLISQLPKVKIAGGDHIWPMLKFKFTGGDGLLYGLR
jgi:hypothetical protein